MYAVGGTGANLTIWAATGSSFFTFCRFLGLGGVSALGSSFTGCFLDVVRGPGASRSASSSSLMCVLVGPAIFVVAGCSQRSSAGLGPSCPLHYW